MPAINEMEYGYDAAGVEAYLEEIQSGALTDAKTAVEDISGINNVLDNEWEGKAKENFKTNLEKDSKHVSDQFQALYEILTSEVNQAQAAMANKDEELIKVG